MSSVKGCTNSKCIAVQKKIKYKATENFCSKCGMPLVYVCKKCHTPVEKNEKLCAMCQAQKEDRKDKMVKMAKDGGRVVVAVGAFALTQGKKIPKLLKK